MDLLPDDIVSLIWGLVLGAGGLVLTSAGRELGKDLYAYIKRKVGPPEPMHVSSKYVPKGYEKGGCVWVQEHQIPNHLEKGDTFYEHPQNRGGKCYRETPSSAGITREYLMVIAESNS